MDTYFGDELQGEGWDAECREELPEAVAEAAELDVECREELPEEVAEAAEVGTIGHDQQPLKGGSLTGHIGITSETESKHPARLATPFGDEIHGEGVGDERREDLDKRCEEFSATVAEAAAGDTFGHDVPPKHDEGFAGSTGITPEKASKRPAGSGRKGPEAYYIGDSHYDVEYDTDWTAVQPPRQCRGQARQQQASMAFFAGALVFLLAWFGLMRDAEFWIAAPSATPYRVAHLASGLLSEPAEEWSGTPGMPEAARSATPSRVVHYVSGPESAQVEDWTETPDLAQGLFVAAKVGLITWLEAARCDQSLEALEPGAGLLACVGRTRPRLADVLADLIFSMSRADADAAIADEGILNSLIGTAKQELANRMPTARHAVATQPNRKLMRQVSARVRDLGFCLAGAWCSTT